MDKFNQFRALIPKVNPWVLVAAIGLLPIKNSLANAACIIAVVLWIIEGDFKRKWGEIKSNPVAWIPLVYMLIVVIGLLWTDDIGWGTKLIRKQRRILFIPIFLTIAKPRYLKAALLSFLSGCSFAALVSFGVALGLIPLFGSALMREDPTVFVNHISYTPMMAWAVYSAWALAGFSRDLSKRWKIGLWAIGLVLMVNLFMTQGVTGYAGCFALFSLLIVQLFRPLWKAAIVGVVAVPLLFVLVFNFSSSFSSRIQENIAEVSPAPLAEDGAHAEVDDRSIGPRLVFWGNTLEIVKKHPVLGAGTGDFPAEYEAVRAVRTPNHWQNVDNPHNQYLLVASQHGVVGLLAFLAIMGAQLLAGIRGREWFRPFQFALPLFFLLIMMGDSYLLGSHSSIIYLVFTAMLFSDAKVNDSQLG